ncbi:DinB family protein OS=Ureibacillus acetophenoni OX=614649 GN=SAMN05877842_103228 PE=4 SV=1 [Ureibacillus acetophenoni]
MNKRHEILFNQIKSYREHVLYLLDELSEQTAEEIPTGYNNNIRWNAGHIYTDQYKWIEHLTKEKTEVKRGICYMVWLWYIPIEFY